MWKINRMMEKTPLSRTTKRKIRKRNKLTFDGRALSLAFVNCWVKKLLWHNLDIFNNACEQGVTSSLEGENPAKWRATTSDKRDKLESTHFSFCFAFLVSFSPNNTKTVYPDEREREWRVRARKVKKRRERGGTKWLKQSLASLGHKIPQEMTNNHNNLRQQPREKLSVAVCSGGLIEESEQDSLNDINYGNW